VAQGGSPGDWYERRIDDLARPIIRPDRLELVIPGHSRNANEPGIHNHRRESWREIVVARSRSIPRSVVMDSGLVPAEPR